MIKKLIANPKKVSALIQRLSDKFVNHNESYPFDKLLLFFSTFYFYFATIKFYYKCKVV